MKKAIFNGELTEPSPGSRAICISCEEDVYSACGQTQAWHWRHLEASDCPLATKTCIDEYSPAGLIPADLEFNADVEDVENHEDFGLWVGHSAEHRMIVEIGAWLLVPCEKANVLESLGVCLDRSSIINSAAGTVYAIRREHIAWADRCIISRARLESAWAQKQSSLARALEQLIESGVVGRMAGSEFKRDPVSGKLMTRI